jgi:hypothetical protein
VTRADPPLPHWPAVLDTALAASYLALSESSFRIVAARAGVQPVELGLSVTRWRRADLDALIDRLPHRGEATTGSPESDQDEAAAALERVRRRAGGPPCAS